MANTAKKILEKKPLTFEVTITENDDRIDCPWFNPITEDKIHSLKKSKRSDRKLVKLKTIANVNGGKRLPKGTVIEENELNFIPYIRATDVKNLKIHLDAAIKIPKEIHQVIQNYQLRENDIAITIVGTIGEVGILDEKVEVCDFTENIARVRVNEESVSPKFLLHYLNSDFGKMQAERICVGSLQYKLSLQSCRNIEVYLPFGKDKFNNVEQNKILAEVYLILKQAEDCRNKSNYLIKEARNVVVRKIGLALPKDPKNSSCFEVVAENNPFSRLDALFNHPLHEKLLNILRKYPNKHLGKLIKIQDDNKIAPLDFYRLVELEQIDENTGRIIDAQEVPQLGSEKILLKKGSILISKLQPEKGKIVIVDEKYDGCVGSSELLPYVLNSSDVSKEYLWAAVRSDYVLKQWEFELTGSSRMRIGPNEINNTIIPIPEPKIQKEIVSEIQEKILESDKVLEKAERLLNSAKQRFVELLLVN